MYCCIRHLATAAAWLCLLGTAAWAADGEDASRPKFLEVYSEGYSRYEITRADNGDQQVVAFFTGGVEFAYRGYRMSADELRYNQADGTATISGAVELRLYDSETGDVESEFSCDELTIDGETGEGTIPGPINGELLSTGISLQAGSGAFDLPAGQAIESSTELTLELNNGVSIETADGLSFTTANATYDGPTGRINAPGQIVLTGTEAVEGAEAGARTVWLSATASSLTAAISQEEGLQWIELAAVNAEFSGGWFSAGNTRLEPEQGEGEAGPLGATAWRIEMLDGPVSGALQTADGKLNFSADQLGGLLDQTGIREIELAGAATLEREDFRLSSSQIAVRRHEGNTYSFDAPELTVVHFDLAQLSGSEPLSIQTIQSWLD